MPANTHEPVPDDNARPTYRNMPGAQVKRRTHQILEVPRLPNQEVFQTLVPLNVDEREGGYQDR